jgi:hypothetical protein
VRLPWQLQSAPRSTFPFPLPDDEAGGAGETGVLISASTDTAAAAVIAAVIAFAAVRDVARRIWKSPDCAVKIRELH